MDLSMHEPTEIDFSPKLFHPFSLIISGSSNTGKSSILLKMIDNFHDSVDISSVNGEMPEFIYIYSIPQIKFEKYKNKVKFYEGTNHTELEPENLRKKQNLILFFDDTADQICPKFLKNIFIQDSHHRNWSVCLIIHNLFDRDIKSLRTCSLNSNYYILTRSPQSLNSIKHLFIQLFPGKSDVVMQIYNEIMQTPYKALLIDNHPASDLKYRLRSNLFSSIEEPTEVFMLNEKKK